MYANCPTYIQLELWMEDSKHVQIICIYRGRSIYARVYCTGEERYLFFVKGNLGPRTPHTDTIEIRLSAS
jgi:hypothetical protein